MMRQTTPTLTVTFTAETEEDGGQVVHEELPLPLNHCSRISHVTEVGNPIGSGRSCIRSARPGHRNRRNIMKCSKSGQIGKTGRENKKHHRSKI